MEEHVGQIWHKLITRAAASHHPHAAVRLNEVKQTVGILFRALGGDGGLRVENATATAHHAHRGWLQRIAGGHDKVELAWRDEMTLRLPECIALFAQQSLNRDLYLWLAALAAVAAATDEDWLISQQNRTQCLLADYPGLAARYQRLLAAELARRPLPAQLPPAEASVERALRKALTQPGSVSSLPEARRPPYPMALWLHPQPPQAQDRRSSSDSASDHKPAQTKAAASADKRRRGERIDDHDGRSGLLAFRLESLFSWSEFVKVDRTADDTPDPDAGRVADDLDVLSIARGDTRNASRLRFDLDLPTAAHDDMTSDIGIPLPEWDYRKQILQPQHCRLQTLLATDAPHCTLPAHLRRTARRLRRQFEALMPTRVWRRGEPDGSDIDLDAWLRHIADRRAGRGGADTNLYRDFRGGDRDLACLLLADLSLSTDAWVGGQGRVIDVIRDSLFLFSEALSATGDRFALYGFSSQRRGQVHFHVLKNFGERYCDAVRGRIQAIKPGYYTRMGAAIRHATSLLSRQRAAQRLLLLLTDGKPNDLDIYEGRYGVEDTRMAIIAARRAGLQPFCVTIDERAEDYLPHLFGSAGFVLIRKPAELPRRLPQLYARLTA